MLIQNPLNFLALFDFYMSMNVLLFTTTFLPDVHLYVTDYNTCVCFKTPTC